MITAWRNYSSIWRQKNGTRKRISKCWMYQSLSWTYPKIAFFCSLSLMLIRYFHFSCSIIILLFFIIFISFYSFSVKFSATNTILRHSIFSKLAAFISVLTILFSLLCFIKYFGISFNGFTLDSQIRMFLFFFYSFIFES